MEQPHQLIEQKEPFPTVDLQTNLYLDHGLLKRALIVLEKLVMQYKQRHKNIQAWNSKKKGIASLIYRTIQVFTTYIHPVHEEAEEKYIFHPSLRANFYPQIIDQLWKQHDIIQGITKQLLALTNRSPSEDHWIIICSLVEDVIRMYSLHEAIEDTVVFPGFYKIVDRRYLYRLLFNDYLDKETRNQFIHSLKAIEAIETELEINLWQVTPSEQQLNAMGVHVHPKSHLL